jgi:nitrogen fixation/metabolism regulation signal transduction histidine kinase
MVPRASGHLTRIGFRRDVKLFLAALVGYLIVVILALLLTMQNSVMTFAQSTEESWNSLVDGLARDLDRSGTSSPQAIQDSIKSRIGESGAMGIELRLDDGQAYQTGINPSGLGRVVERRFSAGTLRVLFDDSVVSHEQRRFKITALICFASVTATAALLLMYIPRILQPIEEMLEHAGEMGDEPHADEAEFVVATFRKTIERLRQQKTELEDLHSREKTRADDLERISSTLKRSMVSGLIATDPDGRIVDLNEPARTILQLGERPVQRELIEDVLQPGELAASLRETLTSRTSISRREVSYRGDSHEVLVGITTVPLFSEENTFLGLVSVFTDLTEVRALEQRVREMQTLADLGEIAAGIAHEFRNSLSTIIGNLRLLERVSDSSDRSGKIEAAKTEAELLAGAVDALLAFAKPTEPEKKRVVLNDLLTALVERLASEAPAVNFSIAGDAAEISGDPTLLRVAFENIVRNAIDAVEGVEGARISIETRAGSSLQVRISDNGIGFDQEDASRFLLPFQSGKSSGFGLGLAMTRRIILMHGGQLRLEGEKGRGATVTVELPLTRDDT